MDTKFLDEFSQEVWSTTYKSADDNTIDDTLRRVATAVASVERTPELQAEWAGKFYDLLTDFKICAGGRILANAGTRWKGTTLMNCFVGPKPLYDQDSLEGIFATLLAQAQTLKSEGGWGMNFSFIRPRGSFIHGIGVETPGAVKYMEIFNKSSDVITAGSGKKSLNKQAKGKIRKGAMMGVLDVWHPDIEEFITAKLQENRLDKFNISVNCSNEFMDRVVKLKDLYSKEEEVLDRAEYRGDVDIHTEYLSEIENLEKWDLIFPDTKHPKYKQEWDGNMAGWKAKGYPVSVVRTIRVSDLWEMIMRSTYTRNDPGVLFLDIANKTHAWNYGDHSHIAATNPCGEQCLPFGAVCNLASINLTQFIDFDRRVFDLEKLKRHIAVAVRFLDDINDLTLAPLPAYLQSIRKRRRIGLGVMGWGSALYLLQTRFGSDRAEVIKRTLMETICYNAVEASIELAKEKGMFEDCDPVKHAESEYWKQISLPEDLKNKIREYGIRNSALFSIQPTGNTGVLANVVSGGLEPVFLHEYIRTVIVPHCPEQLLDRVPKYWEGEFKETDLFKFVKEGDENILRGVDGGIVYKIDKNRGLTKEVPCVDYAVRILKERGEWEPKADWAATTTTLSVEDHIRDMQGFGIWMDSSMSKTVNLPNNYAYEKFKTIYVNAYKTGFLKGITTYRDGTMATVLSAEKKGEIPETIPPKRPKSLKGELHFFTHGKQKFYVAVGLIGSKPYEVFTGINEEKRDLYIPKSSNVGMIRKDARGIYTFVDEEKEEYKLNNGHSDDTADGLTRLVSCSLRHGSSIQFIVEQLQKTRGPMTSFTKILARTLKHYIPDDTISTELCPDCNKKLVFAEGCKKCSNCGHSKCG